MRRCDTGGAGDRGDGRWWLRSSVRGIGSAGGSGSGREVGGALFEQGITPGVGLGQGADEVGPSRGAAGGDGCGEQLGAVRGEQKSLAVEAFDADGQAEACDGRAVGSSRCDLRLEKAGGHALGPAAIPGHEPTPRTGPGPGIRAVYGERGSVSRAAAGAPPVRGCAPAAGRCLPHEEPTPNRSTSHTTHLTMACSRMRNLTDAPGAGMAAVALCGSRRGGEPIRVVCNRIDSFGK